MKISSLSLTNFRKLIKKTFEFSPEITLIVGPNAAGKTNILEAVYLLATGGSWKTSSTDEMIKFGNEVAHVAGTIEDRISKVVVDDRRSIVDNYLSSDIHVTLTRGVVQGKRTSKILYKIKNVPRRRLDFVGQLKVVLFEPESLEIIIGNPGHRRNFLDGVLTQADPEYVRALGIYGKALRTRNRLLDAIRDGRSRIESLEFWEREMVKHGAAIQNKRQEMIEWLNGQMVLALQGPTLQGRTFLEIGYDPSLISESRLEQYRDREIAAGFTLIGPQRDDIVIARAKGQGLRDEGKILAQFGSRGEQRMAVLQLKLLEARWIEEKTGQNPVILLDDAFSELDQEHEKMIGELVTGRQTIMTATEIHKDHYPEAKIIEI